MLTFEAMFRSWVRCWLFLGGLAFLSLLAAGCGGSKSPSIASLGTTTSAGSRAASSGSPSQPQLHQDGLKYAQCMRANGVPNFPDPNADGGFEIEGGAGIRPFSASFKTAQAKCQKLLPGGGPPGPGATTHPSAQALAQMVKVAQCMRRHGVPGFPDPTTSVPSGPPAGGGEISDRDGVILVLPSSLDMQSPLFTRAAAACQFPLHNH